MSQPEVGHALVVLRAGDLDAFSDWLHGVRFATEAGATAALRSLAEAIVAEGLPAGFAPTATVGEITTILMGRCGIPVSPAAIESHSHGQQSRRSLVESGALDDTSVRLELSAAYDEIARLRTERDVLEARVDELAGARVLADKLAAELERDEWIRARLRRLKATRPVRGLLYARRRLRSRTSSAATR
ncbi:MAG TPA: hypothetical protein VM282_15345 [Acidimicrobiales bacterium]|nr:hypothetical protein [Acidimicrobiales bacterium]